jgi:hypothetical protein
MKQLYVCVLLTLPFAAFADPPGPPGTWQQTVMSEWFAHQHNIVNGDCCHNGDGHEIDDNDWRSNHGKYEVRIAGEWYEVKPEIMRDSKSGGPNPTGHAIAWYTYDSTQHGGVRLWCFAPGIEW